MSTTKRVMRKYSVEVKKLDDGYWQRLPYIFSVREYAGSFAHGISVGLSFCHQSIETRVVELS